ncbi:MAG: thiopurine S-methyltransferase [Myxococcales bacterium]|nr:thiopurine S-methyltransferase [Myxococcales bacterium]
MVAPERWLKSWQEGRIGFHRDEVHPDLIRHEAEFLGGGPHRVLVPLAGKTVDLAWLASRGHQVTAVELSPLAAQAFHREQGIDAVPQAAGDHELWRSQNLDYLVGDCFHLQRPAAGPFTRVWDRAAMVALDPERRARYLAHLRYLAPGAQILLNVLTYPEGAREGPPHSIPPSEVLAAYPDATLLHAAEDAGAGWVERTWLATVPAASPG